MTNASAADFGRGPPRADVERGETGRRGARSVRGGSLLLMLVLLAAVFPPGASAVKTTEHECYTGLSAASTRMDCRAKGLTGAFSALLVVKWKW